MNHNPDGVKNHIISMRAEGWQNNKPVYSLAICECGWKNKVAWGEHEAQDQAIYAHWKSAK